MYYCETKTLQQCVHDALREKADGVQNSFFDAVEVVDRSLSLIVGQSRRDESAEPGSPSSYSANRGHVELDKGCS